MALFRFLVALGVGGEWAVASALVAEVFPTRARAWSLSIFHASSVLGTLLAMLAGTFIVAEREIAESIPFLAGMGLSSWRIGFVLGAIPAALIIMIRLSLREDSETWARARSKSDGGLGKFSDLFSPELRTRTVVGVCLAAVGLATRVGVAGLTDRLSAMIEVDAAA